MKYAIVEHGGRQYLAQEGDRIEVDRMALEVGKPVVFKEVLLVNDGKKVQVGAPYVRGARVKGKVLDHSKSKKVVVFKYKPKQRYRRTQGHRQQLTHVEIEDIGVAKSQPKAKSRPKAESEKKPSKKAATSKSRAATAKASSTKKSQSKSKTAKKSETRSKKQ